MVEGKKIPPIVKSCSTCIFDDDPDGYLMCANCRRSYRDLYEPIKLKKSETLCVYCKRVIPDGRIFKFTDDPKRGVCFDCY